MNSFEEEKIMGLIVNSGQARSLAFEALASAKEGDFKVSDEKLEEAEAMIGNAHNIQTELLTLEANGEIKSLSILAVHAQDHLMTAMLAIELLKEIIEIRKEK